MLTSLNYSVRLNFKFADIAFTGGESSTISPPHPAAEAINQSKKSDMRTFDDVEYGGQA